MLRSEDHQTVSTNINGFPVRLTSYRIGEVFYCHIDNLDPGATIARGTGTSIESAKKEAVDKAKKRLVRK